MHIKYLYTGWLPDFGTDEARRRGLLDLGREVITLSFQPFFNSWIPKYTSLQYRIGFGPGIWAYNRSLLHLARKHRPQVVWIDKGNLVAPSTLRTLKKELRTVLVCYNTDDLANKSQGWRLHLPSIKDYDVYITTHRLNAEQELKKLGAKQIILTQMGYNRDLFKRVPITEDETRRLGAEVGFIGHWEFQTEMLFLHLVDLGLPFRVRGASWNKMKNKQKLKQMVEPGIVPTIDYTKALIATKVNLGINSTQNRNFCSGRTFEIAAVGGFLLAQRTIEHQTLFEEGKEAEFFDSAEELSNKARYYLKHDRERREIAEAGYKRCVTSGYSWQERMVGLVRIVEQVLI